MPHLSGAPHWSSADTTTTSDLSPWLNDPRFANAARTPYDVSDDINQDVPDDTSFRVTYDHQYLIVSFQTPIGLDDQADSLLDAVIFGVSDGTTARAVKIGLPGKLASSPADVSTPIATGFTSLRMDAGGAWTTGTGTTAPNWLIAPAAWQNEIRDGAAWGVNFKVNLNDLDETATDTTNLAYAAGTKLRVTFGTISVNHTTLQSTHLRTPNASLASGESWVLANDRMINSNVGSWLQTEPTGDGCTGISLARTSIGVKVGTEYTNPSNWFTLGSTPHLIGSPTEPNPAYVAGGTEPELVPISDGSIKAKFRIANWGSAATTQGWAALHDGSITGPDEVSIVNGHLELTCPPSTTATTCGVALAALDTQKPGQSHQCMLVEMRGTLAGVNFSKASEYRNMYFDTASTIDRTATIDVRGLQAIAGVAANRDVYLYVRRRNMPPAGSTQLELPRTKMYQTRAKVTGEFTCSAKETCTQGVCATPCVDPNSITPCGYGTQRIAGSGCWCVPSEIQKACLPPDPTLAEPQPALGAEQKLATIWPTIEIFPYWDTGKTFTINGNIVKEMRPMTPFGMFIDHAGFYYGFTDLLAGTDVTLTKVATDVYKMTLPNEGTKHLKLTVTAVEQAQPTLPLTEIAGSVSNFGIGASITLTAVAGSTAPLDLSKATVSIDRLLAEGGTDRVTNLTQPDVLVPFPFALPNIAMFGSTTGAPTSMLVFDLPLIGRFTQTTVLLANVTRPSACGLLGGSAKLTTSFTIKDTTHPALAFSGAHTWLCNLLNMVTF